MLAGRTGYQRPNSHTRMTPNKSLEWMAGDRFGSKSNAHRPATTQLARSAPERGSLFLNAAPIERR